MTQALASTQRAVFGATVTFVDLATGADACVAYTGVTAVQAARLAAAECRARGSSWRVRCISTPETILTDIRGERPGDAHPPEPGYMGRANAADLCEFIPRWDGHSISKSRPERRLRS